MIWDEAAGNRIARDAPNDEKEYFSQLGAKPTRRTATWEVLPNQFVSTGYYSPRSKSEEVLREARGEQMGTASWDFKILISIKICRDLRVFCGQLELELELEFVLELIQTQIAQKLMLRAEVHACALWPIG
jgi:hypothetical protein